MTPLSHRDSKAAHERFVQEGVRAGSPWAQLSGQIWLGGSAFLKRMDRPVADKSIDNVPKAQRRAARPSDQTVTAAVLSAYGIKDEKRLRTRSQQEAFQAWVYLLRRVVNLPLREVAARAGVSGSRVSKIQRALEAGPVPATLRDFLIRYKVKN